MSPAEPDTLAWLLRAHATGGRLADTAAIDLLISHRYWLARAAFTRFVHPVTTAEGHHIGAWIDWPAAITTLQHGELPSSASEADMLRLAASLAHGLPVALREVLGGLDADQHHRRDHRHHRRQRRLTTPPRRPHAGQDPIVLRLHHHALRPWPGARDAVPLADHAQAAARIAYGITSRGITVITGEVGVGKTVAARAAIDRAEPARYHLIYIPDPTVGASGIYHHVVTALGGKPSFHNAALVPQARDALAAEHAERGRVPIVCIDEGHLLSHDALEALRLLTNHQLDTESPFATIVLGQPTLATKMKLGTLAALEQRITVRRHMTGMTSQETADYVHHHVKLAGRADPLFTDDAIALIHQSSRGKPRSVNRLAISALIAACAAGKNLVDETSARSAVTENNHDPQPATP